jgi:hypothetical protein
MATWQAAEPGTVIGDGQGNYQIRVAGQWQPMPKGSLLADPHGAYHFDSDLVKPPAAPKASAKEPVAQSIGSKVVEATAGPSDLMSTALLNIPHAAAHAVVDLARRFTGGDTDAPDPSIVQALHVAPGQAGQNLSRDIGNMLTLPPGEEKSDVSPEEQAAFDKKWMPTPNATVPNVLGHIANVAGDVGSLAAAGGAAKGIISGVSAARGAATEAAAAAAADPATQLGLRTAENNPIARSVAGPSGREALSLQNHQVGNTVAGAQAGVPHGTDVGYDSLEAARAAPNAVYGRVAANLPTAPLSDNATAAIRAAGGANRITEGTPDAITNIQSLQNQLLAPGRSFTGDQVVNESRGLRQEGGTNAASDDVSKQHLGRAQLDMARALEQHIADSLPPNGTTSLDQFQAARTALAKNYAVQSSLRGSDVDLQALARVQRGDPDLLTGDLHTLADFANKHPEVSTLPSPGTRYAPPGVGKDLSHVNVTNPSSWVRPILGGLARRSLTGDPEAALGAARSAPVTGLGGEFDEMPMNSLHTPGAVGPAPSRQAPLDLGPPGPGQVTNPTGGLTASPPGAPPAAAAGPPGQLSLADLLSHGVEQSPAAPLSFGPMGTAAPSGMPFARNAAHEAGGLEVAPPQHTYGGKPANNQDLGSVMSQGVPEGIVQRANNASGESAASLEAISRGTRPLSIIDKDGNEQPLMRDVTQIDQRAPKGKILVDTSTGEIIDRGGLPQSHAQGLLNRWATMGRTLGDNFVYGK